MSRPRVAEALEGLQNFTGQTDLTQLDGIVAVQELSDRLELRLDPKMTDNHASLIRLHAEPDGSWMLFAFRSRPTAPNTLHEVGTRDGVFTTDLGQALRDVTGLELTHGHSLRL